MHDSLASTSTKRFFGYVCMTCAILLVCNLSLAQSRQTELNAAAGDGNIGKVRQLLDKGADVNGRNNSKDTALHYAASQGRTEVVAILVQKGADVNAQNHYLETPLHWAAFNDNRGSSGASVRKGAEVNTRNQYQQTPLHWAMDKEMADLLIREKRQISMPRTRTSMGQQWTWPPIKKWQRY